MPRDSREGTCLSELVLEVYASFERADSMVSRPEQ